MHSRGEPVDRRSRSNLGGYIGGLVGCCGWVIGFAVLCAFVGAWRRLWEVGVPGLLLSLCMGVLCIVVLELIGRVWGRQHRLWKSTLWGMACFISGTLLLLIDVWIDPVIARDPNLMEGLRNIGGIRTPGTKLAVAFLAVGLILLTRVAVELLRGAPDETSGIPETATEQDGLDLTGNESG